MNKLMTVFVSGALALASAAPASAATTEPAGLSDAELVALYAPTSSTSSTSFAAAAASDQIVPTRAFYSNLLDYVQAQVAYNGALYDAFRSVGASQETLASLAAAQGRVTNASLSLVTYLQNVLSAS